MRSLRRRAGTLGALLLALTSCKAELDDKPAADPLDDPWVNALDTGEEELPATSADPAPAEAAPAPSEAVEPETPGVEPEALALALAEDADAKAEPASEQTTAALVASKSASSTADGSKPKPSGAKNEPEPSASESAALEPQPEKSPAAEPSPTPSAEPSPAPSIEPAKPAAPPPVTIADFHGNYRFVGGSKQRAELTAAIEAAAQQLAGAIRGIGRKRLTKTNPIDNTLEIVIAGDKVTTIFETGFDATCVIDGPTVHWSNNKGDAYKVRVRSKGNNRLVQIIVGDDGVKTTVFVLSSDKQKLTVHHKITADRLPEPMTYRLSYSRK
ncbi:MAG: hypothetical protein R6X02_11525 [Enhygromyxa sp.]